jgi:uncharacterized protein with HEPN domain
MSRTYKLYLKDILKSIERIRQYTKRQNEDTFGNNPMVVDATLYNLAIIGEAVKKIPDEVKALASDEEWRDIARFRDLIIHHYFGVNLNIVWEVIEEQLDSLEESVQIILDQLEEE